MAQRLTAWAETGAIVSFQARVEVLIWDESESIFEALSAVAEERVIVEDGVELYQKLQQINVTIPEAKSISDLYALKALIESFDRLWCKYESAYVGELMVIERDARRYLYDLCDNKDEPELFFAALGHLNSVANTQGQGR